MVDNMLSVGCVNVMTKICLPYQGLETPVQSCSTPVLAKPVDRYMPLHSPDSGDDSVWAERERAAMVAKEAADSRFRVV